MRKALVILLVLVSFVAQSQADLASLLATSGPEAVSQDIAKEQVRAFVQQLSSSRSREQRLLRKTFHRIHTVFLKKYEAYTEFDKLFTSGNYDCLTATALFSLVLDEMKYSYEIIETNYHIFMIVRTAQGEVLLETTDRFGGFVTGKEKIAKLTGDYRKNQLVADHSKRSFYQYSFNLYQDVSADKLRGLLYFNQAVKAYNHRDWISSSRALEKAQALYASPRCEELGAILIRTILESSMEEKAKSNCLVHLKSFWIKKSEPLASN